MRVREMESYQPRYLNVGGSTSESREDPGCIDPLQDWLTWQESLHIRDIDLGLERTRSVAKRMGIRAPSYSVVTVAGTNGKGSSVAMLDAIWRRAGYSTATYTSPHLLRYNERIRLNGEEADDESLCRVFERIEQARCGESLTYFEYGTLAAFALFEEAGPDIAILEVGLGGRLDAVNTVDPDVALITALGIDHVEWLGGTRESIAREKAGIMRAGKPAVCSDPAVPADLIEIAAGLAAPLELLGQSFQFDDAGDSWSWRSGDRIIDNLPMPNLFGRYQLRNAAGALKVAELLSDRYPVDEDHIRGALVSIKLRGRFERIPGTIEHILDVAHNGQAIRAFVETLKVLPAAPRTHLLLGMRKGKDHESAVQALSPVVDVWHLATLGVAHGATSGELEIVVKRNGAGQQCVCHDTVEGGYEAMLAAAEPGDRVIVIGSFVTVGSVMKKLSRALGA